MLMTRQLAAIGASLMFLAGCAHPQGPAAGRPQRSCPSVARCPGPPAAPAVAARLPVPDPWPALKDLEPLPDGLEPPAILRPAPATAEKPAKSEKQSPTQRRFLDFADEELTAARPGAEPAPDKSPPAREAQLRLDMENDLVLGRHDLALGRLIAYVREVAGGKQPRPADALLGGLRQELLALARETAALAMSTKSRRFLILGLAAYQLLARLPQPAAGGDDGDADRWRQEQEVFLYWMLSAEARALTLPPPAPRPPRKPGERQPVPVIILTGRPVVYGTLEASAIRRVIRRRLPEVRACYAEALGRAPVAGVFQLLLTVDGWGRVTQAGVGKNATGDAMLARCVEERMRAWIFPEVMPPKSLTQINYPLILSPDN